MLFIFTLVHVLISLGGIFAGFVAVFEMIGGKSLNGWTTWFLGTTVATSVTGFMFPVDRFMPSHGVGIISMIVLALAYFALYRRRLAGGWSKTYVITAVLALYLNFFVLVVQLFGKIPALKALAPTQSEPPFAIAQTVTLIGFIVLGVLAVRGFKTAATNSAMA